MELTRKELISQRVFFSLMLLFCAGIAIFFLRSGQPTLLMAFTSPTIEVEVVESYLEPYDDRGRTTASLFLPFIMVKPIGEPDVEASPLSFFEGDTWGTRTKANKAIKPYPVGSKISALAPNGRSGSLYANRYPSFELTGFLFLCFMFLLISAALVNSFMTTAKPEEKKQTYKDLDEIIKEEAEKALREQAEQQAREGNVS